MARLHLMKEGSVKCVKCDCIILTDMSNTTNSEPIWSNHPENCSHIPPAGGKPLPPIQASKY